MTNINLYNYSYANAIGCSLRHPLFKLVSNIAVASSSKPLESLVWQIAKIAFHSLVAALFVIPAAISWLAGKSISHFSATQIAFEGLYLAPPPVPIPQEIESDQSIDIRVLSEKFRQLNLPNREPSDRTSKQKSMERLCEWTATKHRDIYPDTPRKRELFCTQLSFYLKDIIKKINSGEISREKETQILVELAEASKTCYPTWLEVSARIFEEINAKANTVEAKLLRCIQQYKESLILEFGQKEADAQWHVLNFVRNILGKEIGLNTTLNSYDPYAARNDVIFGRALTKWLFLQRYENVNRLISAVTAMINHQEYDRCYHDFLQSTVTQQGIPNAADFVTTHFYTEDCKLNESGTNLLLRSIGILK